MESLLIQKSSKYAMSVWIHDKLRVCASWFHLRQDDILKRKLRRSAGKWMKGLMRRLLQITHQQWTYRNATVHLKMKDGRTTANRPTRDNTIRNTGMCVCRPRRPPKHQHLVGCNFTKLVTGPTKDKVEFVAEMRAARSLARHIAKGTKVALKTRYAGRTRGKLPRRNTVIEEVVVDSEGSLKWRRRRRC